MTDYLTPAGETTTELEIKRSQFITFLARAENRQQALDYIQSVRDKHPQARHVCWAYIAGAPDTTVLSMSDDGEPSGTAGRPMLAALQHSGLGEVVAAVVRYFGGIKLGTGGLQRAYSDAVVQTLAECQTLLKRQMGSFNVIVDYSHEQVLRRSLEEVSGQLVACNYSEHVQAEVVVPVDLTEQWQTLLTNLTAGNISIKNS